MIDLRCGDVLAVLREMPSASVHCIVTSPPYWGLRSYGTEPQVWADGKEPCETHEWVQVLKPAANGQMTHAMIAETLNGSSATRRPTRSDYCAVCGAFRGELGLEPTPELYVKHLVQIFREARRVLRADGTLWLNIGDSYAGSWGAMSHGEKESKRTGYNTRPPTATIRGIKEKDLVGIPWMVAFALRGDGWYLRQEIIWAKPNPMPESVRDRPTRAHEQIFLLAKSPRYYFDGIAIAEPVADASIRRILQSSFDEQAGGKKDYGQTGVNASRSARKALENFAKKASHAYSFARDGEVSNHVLPGQSAAQHRSERTDVIVKPTRNKRSVWFVPVRASRIAHFATFNPDLIEPCILAGTSECGVCSRCGAPYERVVEKNRATDGREQVGVRHHAGYALSRSDHRGKAPSGLLVESVTSGWKASCDCDAGEPVPATVLDPFGGSGTTGLVAAEHGRNAILIDLKPEYVQMARERIAAVINA